MNDSTRTTGREDNRNERMDALEQLDEWLQTPMICLSFLWPLLLIVEFIWGNIRLFERASEIDDGFKGYGDALCWIAMLLTTIGSAFWPQTVEGRLLCFIRLSSKCALRSLETATARFL